MNQNARTILGFLSHPVIGQNDTDMTKGIVKCLFESIKGQVYPINKKKYFDDSDTCFLYDGYKETLGKTNKRLFKFDSVENINYESGNPNHTKNATFRRNVRDANGVDCFFSVIDMCLPSNVDMREIILPRFPVTPIFFIRQENSLYGPFSAIIDQEDKKSLIEFGVQDSSHIKGQLLTIPTYKVLNVASVPFGYILKIEMGDLIEYLDAKDDACYVDSGEAGFVFYDKQRLANVKFEKEMYLSQTDVMNILESVASTRIVSKPAINAIKTHLNSLNIALNPEIKAEVEAFFDGASKRVAEHESLLAVLKGTTYGKEVVEEYLAREKSSFLSNWSSIAKKQQKELSNDITKLTKQKETLAKGVETSKHELNALSDEVERKAEVLRSELSDELMEVALKRAKEEHDKALWQLNEETERLKKSYSDIADVEYVINNLEEAGKYHKLLANDIKKKEDSIESLNVALKDGGKKLKETMIGIAPLMEAFGGGQLSINAPEKVVKKPIYGRFNDVMTNNIKIKSQSQAALQASCIVNSIAREFSERFNHHYSNEFIASVIIAKTQSLISIFVGPPGSGKSSFVRLLKEITKQGPRFLEIGVSRGWTGDKDFIGFYNSITEQFSPAASGFYSYIKGIEGDKKETAPNHTVLLDEANLSAIEHYGASILKMSDPESDMEIRAHDEVIKLPKDISFVATVNVDPTTEPLSPRLIDRAPVIPFELFGEQELDYSDEKTAWPVASMMMTDLFGEKSKLCGEPNSTAIPQELLDVIQELMGGEPKYGLPINVSARKKDRAAKYFHVLKEVIHSSSDESQSISYQKALDYTALYYLLPLIFVSGEAGRNRLNGVLSVLETNNMHLSATKVKDILVRGSYNFDVFSYLHY